MAEQLRELRGQRQCHGINGCSPQTWLAGLPRVAIPERQIQQHISDDVTEPDRWIDKRYPSDSLPMGVILETGPRQDDDQNQQHGEQQALLSKAGSVDADAQAICMTEMRRGRSSGARRVHAARAASA